MEAALECFQEFWRLIDGIEERKFLCCETTPICALCLQNFKVGDDVMGFSSCLHILHSDCFEDFVNHANGGATKCPYDSIVHVSEFNFSYLENDAMIVSSSEDDSGDDGDVFDGDSVEDSSEGRRKEKGKGIVVSGPVNPAKDKMWSMCDLCFKYFPNVMRVKMITCCGHMFHLSCWKKAKPVNKCPCANCCSFEDTDVSTLFTPYEPDNPYDRPFQRCDWMNVNNVTFLTDTKKGFDSFIIPDKQAMNDAMDMGLTISSSPSTVNEDDEPKRTTAFVVPAPGIGDHGADDDFFDFVGPMEILDCAASSSSEEEDLVSLLMIDSVRPLGPGESSSSAPAPEES